MTNAWKVMITDGLEQAGIEILEKESAKISRRKNWPA